MQKHITIFYGGTDDERVVSEQSYKTALAQFQDTDKFHVESIQVMPDGTWQKDNQEISQDVALQWTDFAWIAMHGAYGEDGTLQKILESHRVPHNGSESLWSRLCFSKSATKDLFNQIGIKTPAFQVHNLTDVTIGDLANDIFQNFPQPCVIKPDAGGSSFGVAIVDNKSEIEQALKKNQSITDKVIVEELITGIEATAGVVENLRGQKIYKLPPVEIVPENQFFDYDAKYNGSVNEICPATFSDELKRQLQDIAAQIHTELHLSDYSRTDFMIHPDRGIYVLEVNTLPGMTQESLLPKELEAVGVSLEEFFMQIITNNLHNG